MDRDFIEEVSHNDILMEEMALYAEKYNIQGMMKHYMSQLVLQKPSDPLQFLIDEIKHRPFIPEEVKLPEDLRPPAEKRKYMDTRPQPEKENLLIELFEHFCKNGDTSKVRKAKMLVLLRKHHHLILERFPKHFHEMVRYIEMVPADTFGNITKDSFLEYCLKCLSGPGGRTLMHVQL